MLLYESLNLTVTLNPYPFERRLKQFKTVSNRLERFQTLEFFRWVAPDIVSQLSNF